MAVPVYAQNCHDPNPEKLTFRNGISVTSHACKEANGDYAGDKLVWRHPQHSAYTHTHTVDGSGYAGMTHKQISRNVVLLDYYQERGGTLFLVNWSSAKPQFYRLDYTGHDESGMCARQVNTQIHIRHCAFGKNLGRDVLKLQITSQGWRVLNPKVLPKFTDELPEYPKSICRKYPTLCTE